MGMKTLLSVVIVAAVFTACNTRNEDQASIQLDSLRIIDSTQMSDSLRIIDTTNRLLNKDTTQQ